MNANDVIGKMIEAKMRKQELYSVVATVDSVDNSARTCVCTPVSGAKIEDVKLQANESETVGVVMLPAVDSYVIVTFLSKETAFVSLMTEIDDILIDINNDIVINGGNNDGLVKVGDLVTKLNNLENDLNTLKTAFSGWTPIPNDGGAALKTATAAWYAATLTQTVQADLENTKVKH